MFDGLIQKYGQWFYKFQEQNKNPFMILCSSVAVILLGEFYYRKFTKEEIMPLEKLPDEKKKKYWDLSKEYSTEKEKRIAVCKAAYVLELITSTF